MKTLKFILFLCITISLASCGSDDDGNSFELSTANIAGMYKITAYKSVEKESATSASGNVVNLSTTTKTSDTNGVILTLNASGTFTATKSFRINSVVNPTPNNGQPEPEIVTFNSKGSFILDTTAKTISFTETTNEGYIKGFFEIKNFNADKLILKKETDTAAGSNTINAITDITLERN